MPIKRQHGNQQPNAAIAGLGMTQMGRVYGRSAIDFAVEAVALAIEDCGINKGDIDGLLISGGLCSYLNMPGTHTVPRRQ